MFKNIQIYATYPTINFVVKILFILLGMICLLNSFFALTVFALNDPPPLETGSPAPGKRVKAYADNYASVGNSDIFHALYLPTDWTPNQTYPVIVEYAGNAWPYGTGLQEEAKMGYGLSEGIGYIWIVMPFVDTQGTDSLSDDMYQPKWWGSNYDPTATINYVKDNLETILDSYGGDKNNVTLVGFSRGSIAMNYIGLADDEIAKYWTAFYGHDHYDGVKGWGYSGSDKVSALERLDRLDGRPQLLTYQNTGIAEAVYPYFMQNIPDGDDVTFLPIPGTFLTTQQASGGHSTHHVEWMYSDNDYINTVRDWFYAITKDRRIMPVAAVASSEYNEQYVAHKVIDGDNASIESRWISERNFDEQWLVLDLAKNYRIEGFEFWTGWQGYNTPLSIYQVDYWDETNGNWEQLYVSNNPTAVENVTLAPHEQKITSRIRLKTMDSWVKIYEFRLYGDPLVYPYGQISNHTDYSATPIKPRSAVATSTYNSVYTADKAIDGDVTSLASRWISFDSSYQELTLAFDTAQTMSQVRWWTGFRGYNTPITHYNVKYYDQNQWKPTGVVVYDNEEPIVIENFDQQVTTDQIKLATNYSWVKLYEIELYNCQEYLYLGLAKRYSCLSDPNTSNNSATNVALGKSVTTDSEYNGIYVAEKLVDGDKINNVSRWVSTRSGNTHWLEVDLSEEFNVSQVKFWTGYNGYNYPLSSYNLQYWNGTGWDDLVSRSVNSSAIIDEQFDVVLTSKIRMEMTGWALIYEFEVYGY